MNTYLVPARTENIEKSIITPVNSILKKVYKKTYSFNVGAWAITNANKCAIYGKEIEPGDKFLIFAVDDSDQFFDTTVIEKITDKVLPLKIWGGSEEENFYYTFILKIERQFTLSRKLLFNVLDYKMLWGITKLSSHRSSLVKGFISGVVSSINSTKKIEEILIEKYWENDDIDLVIAAPPKNAKGVSGELATKPPKGKGEKKTPIPAKQLGITGEYIFFHACKRTDFLKQLEAKLKIVSPIRCNWYNEKVDIKNQNFVDGSIGKGHDMKLCDKNYIEVEVEIKTSYKVMEYFTLTRNEIKEMCNTKNLFIIALIDKISSKPRVRILSNLKDLLGVELPNVLKELPLYVNSIPEKYFM